MSSFRDEAGKTWTIQFDGLLLDDVLTETGIDLADLSAGGLSTIDQDAKKLVKVLVVLCGPLEIDEREFSRLIVRDVITAAREAIVSAAANFFPPSEWSEIQQLLDQQREFNQQWATIRPMVQKLNEPGMPAELREAVMGALTKAMDDMTPATTSEPSGDDQNDSATGPADTPPTPAPSVRANVELTSAG
jgi:hypothetical protein